MEAYMCIKLHCSATTFLFLSPFLSYALLSMNSSLRFFLSSRDSANRLTEQPALTLQSGDPVANVSVLTDERVAFQTHLGFGGAFTEAAAVTLGKLSPDNRATFLRAYF